MAEEEAERFKGERSSKVHCWFEDEEKYRWDPGAKSGPCLTVSGETGSQSYNQMQLNSASDLSELGRKLLPRASR